MYRPVGNVHVSPTRREFHPASDDPRHRRLTVRQLGLIYAHFGSQSEEGDCNSLRISATKTGRSLAWVRDGFIPFPKTISGIMDELAFEQLERNPKWTSVLEIYQDLSLRNRDQFPEFDGWTARVHQAPEIAEDELPGIHGKLIAFGFLKFDLAGRDLGVRYQLTPLGRQAINGSILAQDE